MLSSAKEMLCCYLFSQTNHMYLVCIGIENISSSSGKILPLNSTGQSERHLV